MKRQTLSLISVVILVILIIIVILYVKSNNDVDEKIIKCIAENSKLYASRTCSACALQKQILGNYTELFDIIDCAEFRQECLDNEIISIPTWIINNEKYIGIKSIEELKELTGC